MLTLMLATSLGALILVQHQDSCGRGIGLGAFAASSATATILAAVAGGVAFSLPLLAPASHGPMPRARMLVFAASVRTAGALSTPSPKIGDQEYGPHSEIEHVKHHGLRCGTDEHPHVHDDEHGRALAKSDCGFSTDPKPIYSPTQGPIYRIKTCIHVIMSSDGLTGAISQACIHGGMAWLNRDFRATAGEKSANSVDTRIEFQLIKTLEHKNTAWMTQDHGTPGGLWDAATGECDVSRASNIFIKTPPGGILGQASLAHNARGTAPDGSTIGTSVWGPCATSGSYNEGATATHELGHYLGLYHTFVSSSQSPPLPASSCPAQTKPGCYGRPGDTLCDTNAQANAEFSCDNENECGENEPIHNYMDYSHDSCLTTFTEEQARRMRCALTSYRSGIYTEHAGGWVGPLTSPNPPSWPIAPSPPTRSCTCKASWTLDGVTSSGCANPDQDSRGPWCFHNEGTGCLLSDSTPSTFSWFYCTIDEPPPSPSPPPTAHCRPTLLSARARPVGAAAAPRLLAVPTPTTTAAARTATPTRVVTASSQMAYRRPFPTSTARRVCVPPHGSTMVSAAQAVPTPCASPCTDRVASLPMAHRPPPTMHRVRLRRHLRQCTSSRLRRLPTRRRHPGVHARRSRMAFLGTAPAT